MKALESSAKAVEGQASQIKKFQMFMVTLIGLEQMAEVFVLILFLVLYPYVVCDQHLHLWGIIYAILSVILLVISILKLRKTSQEDTQSLLHGGSTMKVVSISEKTVHIVALVWVAIGSFWIWAKHGVCSEKNYTLVLEILIIAFWVKIVLFIIFAIISKLVMKI